MKWGLIRYKALAVLAVSLFFLSCFSSATHTVVNEKQNTELKGTGFFQTQKIDGTWWFITPEGEKLTLSSTNSSPGPGGLIGSFSLFVLLLLEHDKNKAEMKIENKV